MKRIGVDQDVVLTFAFNPELLQILFTNILSSFPQDLLGWRDLLLMILNLNIN